MKNEVLLRIPIKRRQLVFGVSLDTTMFHLGIGILDGGFHIYLGHIKLFTELWVYL